MYDSGTLKGDETKLAKRHFQEGRLKSKPGTCGCHVLFAARADSSKDKLEKEDTSDHKPNSSAESFLSQEDL